MQNIKRNHHIHTRSKSPKTTPILIFCTYNQSLDEKKNSNKEKDKLKNSCSRKHSPTTRKQTHIERKLTEKNSSKNKLKRQ